MAGPDTACAMFLRGPKVLAESSRTLMLVWILAVAKNVSDEESESREMGMLLLGKAAMKFLVTAKALNSP